MSHLLNTKDDYVVACLLMALSESVYADEKAVGIPTLDNVSVLLTYLYPTLTVIHRHRYEVSYPQPLPRTQKAARSWNVYQGIHGFELAYRYPSTSL